MATVNVVNVQGQTVAEIELNDDIFGAEIKPHLHWEIVRNQLANRRAGTHSTKTRTTVSGTTRKSLKQKVRAVHVTVQRKRRFLSAAVLPTVHIRAITAMLCPSKCGAPRCAQH